jgi:DNA mismatch endonuclease (patch repair protein)
MPDVVDAAIRSRMMSGIRGRNTQPELTVRRFLHGLGFRYRLHDRRLPGKPDIVLSRYRTAIFVHGCFWHQHAGCKLAAKPGTHVEFWRTKLSQNVERDARDVAALTKLGWEAVIMWECGLNGLDWLPARIRDAGTKRRDRRDQLRHKSDHVAMGDGGRAKV